MKKIKLYIYPQAKAHEHDTNTSGLSNMLYNTVPFSEKGIQNHCVLTSPEEADYFYMGQFANDFGELVRARKSDFRYFAGNESRHILDIDGEGGFEASNRPAIPFWLHKSIITTMGPLKRYSNIEFLFTRPTFSHLLIDIVKNCDEDFNFPNRKSFGLRAFMNHKVRAATLVAMHKGNFEKEIHVNKKWEGLSPVGSSTQKQFIETMLNNSLSLCPRGSGIDSVRFLETCYFKRVPIVITDYDYCLFGEDEHDLSFCYKIHNTNMNPDFLLPELKKIYNTPIEELEERASAARQYFDKTLRSYFADPTLYFLRWLERKNVKK